MENYVIEMDELFTDSCAKSIAESLIQMFDVIIGYKDESVKEFIKNYIPEVSEFFIERIEGFKNNRYAYNSCKINEKRRSYLQLLEDIRNEEDLKNKNKLNKKATEMMYTLTGEYNSGIYNLSGLLILIDDSVSLDDIFIIRKAIGEEEQAIYESIHKLESIVMIMLGTASYAMDIDFKKEGKLTNNMYNVSPNIVSRIKNIRCFQEVKNGLINIDGPLEEYCYIFEICQMIDLLYVRKQLAFQKILIALHFLRCSPEYDAFYEECSNVLIKILSELLYCGEIYKIYLQEGYFDESVEAKDRGAHDYTTRISIILRMENEDIYILRIDLPHKGENAIHLNFEEVVGDSIIPSGIPFQFNEYKDVLKMLSDEEIQCLFYEMHNQYWFRTKAKSNIKKLKLEQKIEKKVIKIFDIQSHKDIPIESVQAGEFNDYLEELKKYILRFGLIEGNLLCFTKGTIDYQAETMKIRKLQNISWEIGKKILSDVDKNVYSIIKNSDLAEVFRGVLGENVQIDGSTSILDIWDMILKI